MISFGLLVDAGTGIAPAPAGPSGIDGGPLGTAGGFAPGLAPADLIDGIAGTTLGNFGIVGTACFVAAPGKATRDLQLEHVTNFAPTGTSVSAMRLCVPHAEQVASIIRNNHTPAPTGLPVSDGVVTGNREPY